MALFVLFALVFVGVVLIFLLPPLLGRGHGKAVDRDSLNIALFKDRSAELEAELAEGTLSQDQYEQARNELRRDLLANTGTDAADAESHAGPRWATWAVAAAVPLLAVALYAVLGSPQLLLDPTGGGGNGPHQAAGSATDMRQMVEQLSVRLQANPDDLEGWVLLGRSLVALKEYDKAARAYATARRIAGDVPELLMESAQALAMAQQGELAGAPMALVRRVLELEPQHDEALWFSGVDAFQRGAFRDAIALWNRLLPQLEDAESAQTVRGSIERAEAMLTQAGAAEEAAAGQSVKVVVQVSLAPELASAAAPGDTVFVFARAPQGPRMPIVAERLTVAQLPATVTLDDNDGMAGQRLSSFDKVVVVARVAKSGGVGGQAGDLEGEVTLDVGGEASVRIARIIP